MHGVSKSCMYKGCVSNSVSSLSQQMMRNDQKVLGKKLACQYKKDLMLYGEPAVSREPRPPEGAVQPDLPYHLDCQLLQQSLCIGHDVKNRAVLKPEKTGRGLTIIGDPARTCYF